MNAGAVAMNALMCTANKAIAVASSSTKHSDCREDYAAIRLG
nr:hypothetical protein [uncultured Campylobacter sp.]